MLNLPFKEDIRRADRDNTIDVYISDDYMDVLADGVWEQFFTEKPEPLTREEKRAWLDTMHRRSLWAPTRSSPLATTSSAPTAAA